VAAFRATLEELADASVLLHVVDASHPAMLEHMAAVDALLTELEVVDRPTVLVLNKIDRMETHHRVDAVLAERGGGAISAPPGEGIAQLHAAIDSAPPSLRAVRLRIPHGDGAALASCYERGRVLSRQDEDGHVSLTVELPPVLPPTLASYRE